MVVHKHKLILSLIESKSPLICTAIMGSNLLSGQRVTTHQVWDSSTTDYAPEKSAWLNLCLHGCVCHINQLHVLMRSHLQYRRRARSHWYISPSGPLITVAVRNCLLPDACCFVSLATVLNKYLRFVFWLSMSVLRWADLIEPVFSGGAWMFS